MDMRKTFKSIVGAAALMVLGMAPVHATVIPINFTGTWTGLNGSVGDDFDLLELGLGTITGSVTYDDDLLSGVGDEFLDLPNFTVAMNIGSESINQNFFSVLALEFFDNQPFGFTDPDFFGIDLLGGSYTFFALGGPLFSISDNLNFDDLFGEWDFDLIPPVSVPVPEPGSLALLGIGLVALFGAKRRRRVS